MPGIKTVGELRDLLVDAIAAVRDGNMEAVKANDIAKLAGRINDNFFAEVAVSKEMRELGAGSLPIGSLPIGKTNNVPT